MTDASKTASISAKPLYAQVRDQLVRRLVTGEWLPGMLIPSEQEIARTLNVSQGTVRKALDTMTADNLLVRRQGRGTFVSQPEDSRIMFQFFRLSPESGEAGFPQSTVMSATECPAPPEAQAALGLKPADPVCRIDRIRSLAGVPVINEVLWLPLARFTGLAELSEIPNNIYQLLSARWGVTIARAEEQLRADAATPQDADRLGCTAGHPLITIRRVAFDLEDTPVELRHSRCLTNSIHYSVSLR